MSRPNQRSSNTVRGDRGHREHVMNGEFDWEGTALMRSRVDAGFEQKSFFGLFKPNPCVCAWVWVCGCAWVWVCVRAVVCGVYGVAGWIWTWVCGCV